MFAAINSVGSAGAYFGNGITSPGTIFGGALSRETGEISKFNPQGKLPFELPKTLKTVQDQKSDLGCCAL